MDMRDTLTRLDMIETELLSCIEQIRSLRLDLVDASESGPQIETFLDADAIAKLLSVDTAYVYGLARAKKIPSIKLGKYRRFSPLQIAKWIERKARG